MHYASVLIFDDIRMVHLVTTAILLGLAVKSVHADPLPPPTAPTPQVELLTTVPEPDVSTETPESAENLESSKILAGAKDERQQHWASLGYTLRFDHSVTESDFGRSGEDFLTDRDGWANGKPTHTNWIDESLITFTAAPRSATR